MELRRKSWLAAVMAGMFVAVIGFGLSCSKREGDISAVANPQYVKPIGNIIGKIVDACTDLAIENVEVSISVKGKKKTYVTGNSGQFSFADLPVNFGPPDYYSGGSCYVVVANFEKYNKKEAEAAEDEGRDARPYPATVEGEVCLVYAYINNNCADGDCPAALTVTGSGAATVVDGQASGVILRASRPVGTVIGEAFWGKDKSPAAGVALNLYWETGSGVYLEGQAVVQADGSYRFSAVHECQSYSIAPAKPCFDLGEGSEYGGDSFTVLASQLSPPYDLSETYVACIQLDPIPCLDVEGPCAMQATPREYMDIEDLSPSIEIVFSELMDEELAVDEIITIAFDGWKALGDVPDVGYTYSWDTDTISFDYPEMASQEVSVLTLTPTVELLPGAKYVVNLMADPFGLGLELMDLAGNAYDPDAPICSREATNNDGDILFTTRYGGACPVLQVAQVDKTANNVTSGLAQVTDMDMDDDDYPVMNTEYWNPVEDVNSEYSNRQVVITWPQSGEETRVKAYRVYARAYDSDPWIRVADEDDLGPHLIQTPKNDIAILHLAEIDQILDDAGVGRIMDLDSTLNWGDALSFNVSVVPVTADGFECPIETASQTAVGDNTPPIVVRNYKFSVDPLKYGDLFTTYFYDDGGSDVWDTLDLGALVPGGVAPWDPTQSIEVCSFGQLKFEIPILEDVDPDTIGGVDLVDTSATGGICDLTFCPGWYTEPNDDDDGTVASRRLQAKNTVVTVVNNAYKLDTGDRLILTGTDGPLADVAGNLAENWVHIVDTIPPLIKSIVINATSDTITVTFTERIDDDLDNIDNFDLGDLGDGNPAGSPVLQATDNYVDPPVDRDPDADNDGYSIAAATADDESVVTIYLDDVSFIQQGDIIELVALEDDAWSDSGQTHNASNDDGTWAYWYGDPANPGAYYPLDTASLGTRTSMPDRIGPRLDRTNQPVAIAGTLAPGAAANIDDICFTENLDNPAGDQETRDPERAANWSIRVRDCGLDASCGETGETTVAVENLVISVADADYCFDADFTVPNVAGHLYQVDIAGSSITVSNVEDESTTGGTSGNGQNIISTHNAMSYVTSATFTGWQRN